MNRPATILAIVVTGAVSAVAGYWFGVREGMVLGIWADSIPRGVMGAGVRSALASGESERLRVLFESDVDGGLLNLYRLDNSPFRDLLPFWGLPEFSVYEEYGTRLAKYRKLNPSPFQYENPGLLPDVKEANPELYREMLQNGQETARALAESISRYSTKP